MKHNTKVTLIILSMFLITQFIGLYVISSATVPSFLSSNIEGQGSHAYLFYQLIISLILAIFIVVIITKYKLRIIMKIWFLTVIIIALSISLSAILKDVFGLENYIIALSVAVIFGLAKTLRSTPIIHNATELLIYPGLATIFVPILTPIYAIVLLIIISIYDMWAVWHSGIMQKMAKFQMDELKIFGGFLIPYIPKDMKKKIKLLKQRYKNKKIPEKIIKKEKIKISMAILGGGDIIFPIITAGVFMLSLGMSYAISVIIGALFGLSLLLLYSEKKKFYPAMPFISGGIFLGLAVCWLIKFLF